MELDLRQVLKIARRWWWVLALMPIIAGGAAFGVSSMQTPRFASSVLVRINPPASSVGDVNGVRLTQDLAETYRLLIVTQPVLDEVIADLDLTMETSDLEDNVSAEAISGTQLVRVTVQDTDAARAADTANAIASTFTTYMQSQTDTQIEAALTTLDQRTADLQARVEALDEQIAELDNRQSVRDASTQSSLDILISDRTQLQDQIAQLEVEGESVAVDMAAAQAQVSVSEPATAPDRPDSPRTTLNVALGLVAGLMLALGVIALLQYMDNTVSSASDVTTLTGATVLASIPRADDTLTGQDQVYSVTKPWTPQAEAIRMLRANLQFAAAGAPTRSLTITSAQPGEGKTTVAANLAVVLAHAGLNTLLVDADLRMPTQHKVFGVPNDRGLTTLLTQEGQRWQDAAYRVVVPNLRLLSSGPIPPNPSDLLSLARFPELLAGMESEVDIVLIDTPPALVVADPLAVARHTDGVILVARSSETRREAIRQAAQLMEQGDIRLLGMVLNQVKLGSGDAYQYYEAYSASQREAPSFQIR